MTHRVRWSELADSDLFRLPLRELGLTLRGTALEEDLRELGRQLGNKRIAFRPHSWVSTEWFSPDGIPGFAVPFYLLHPRLARIEQSRMGEVEGKDRRSRRRLLRHEAGHAIDTAYQLFRREGYRRLFGRVEARYKSKYYASPTSRHYVYNLPLWYAQSHPSEDFAETFAVWLDPESRWRVAYRGWPALEKLQYVDELMRSVRSRAPARRSRRTVDPIGSSSDTLGGYYENKRGRYRDAGRSFDGGLARVFPRSWSKPALSAGQTIRRFYRLLFRSALLRSEFNRYSVNQAIGLLAVRAGYLQLPGRERLGRDSRRVLEDLSLGFLERLEQRRDGLVR